MSEKTLLGLTPADFTLLEAIPESWAPATETERRERRATASITELRAFYDGVGPLVPGIAAHLDAFPIDAPLPPEGCRLFRLAQMYMEAAWAVEVVGAPEEAYQMPRHRWKITPVLHAGKRGNP
ncbi:MAG TPA: hypothetical protein VN692_19630 [Steroidobacteraceae bacterium]|nr:hypothetical protein [Steroidobacteraceae bacterium]